MKLKTSIFLSVIITLILGSCGGDAGRAEGDVNLALIADLSSSQRYMNAEALSVLNDGIIPDEDSREGAMMFWSRRGSSTTSVDFTWPAEIATSQVRVHWLVRGDRLGMPASVKLGKPSGEEFEEFVLLSDEVDDSTFVQVLTFAPALTQSLRLEVTTAEGTGSAVTEVEVISDDSSVKFAPVVVAGKDRSVMTGGNSYLNGSYKSLNLEEPLKWSKVEGPGKVVFADKASAVTSATFSAPGEYVVRLTAGKGALKGSSDLNVKVFNPPPDRRLDVVYTKNYSIDNPLWNDRAKSIIVNWIPWCIEQIENSELETGQGGLDNFIEAAKALRGEPHGRHKGYVFSNAWVHQTVESMAIALMVDAKGDPEILEAQELFRETLEKWIPVILAAQEPDGYLQTAYTLRDTARWKNRWEDRNRSAHEGYVAGYFIESAINHYTLTDGEDTRLYDAAKKLSDCWVANIGPDKIEWFDGHQEMEQALVRFGRFVNDMEGNGRGDAYIDLAKFLLDSRGGGSEYDQSHVRVQEQYEAVGHAVRAVYSYSAMADVAAETADVDYQSAVMSLWDNMVNRKYYVTGGVGSGETSEGFGPDYSLRHNAYCESCSSCGLIFFQYKMNLAYHDAMYADLYEETMYNALLGSLDLEGKNFYYTNPLTQRNDRYSWHVCPCCVGNIPRTLLMVPTWSYLKGDDGVYVNLFIGGSVNIENVAGTDVQMVQKTDYPWDGKVSVTVNPANETSFRVYVRVPNRKTSVLYTAVPEVSGLKYLKVNGEDTGVNIENGYAVIDKSWKAGDVIEFELPMEIQLITSDSKVAANEGLVALRYGPLVFTVENIDQENIDQPLGTEALTAEWREDMLHGIMTIKGSWKDSSPLLAIPYYARNNRTDQATGEEKRTVSRVWINEKE